MKRPFTWIPLSLLLLAAHASSRPQKHAGPVLPRADGGDVIDLRCVSTTARVLYRAEGEQLNTFELYSVQKSGGPAVRLSPDLSQGGHVAADFIVSPDGQSVYFRADADNVGQWDLYARAIDGSGTALRLNTALAPEETVAYFDLTDDGTQVVYMQGMDELFDYRLYSAPADASGPPIGIAGLGPFARVVGFELVPGSQHAVFFGLAPGSYQISAVPLDGSSFSEPLSGALTWGCISKRDSGLRMSCWHRTATPSS